MVRLIKCSDILIQYLYRYLCPLVKNKSKIIYFCSNVIQGDMIRLEINDAHIVRNFPTRDVSITLDSIRNARRSSTLRTSPSLLISKDTRAYVRNDDFECVHRKRSSSGRTFIFRRRRSARRALPIGTFSPYVNYCRYASVSFLFYILHPPSIHHAVIGNH